MKKAILIIILVIILGLGGFWYYKNQNATTVVFNNSANQQTNNTPMNIVSPVFLDGQNIPRKYTCDDLGVNPPLEFKNIPKETVSLVLIMDDPDAPKGTWTHWTLWNIDPSIVFIAENTVPVGAVQGQTSSGQNAYGGPCPPVPSPAEGPSGEHHYHFKLFALDTKLTIPSFSDSKILTTAMNGHIISQAELVGTYAR